jgi:hypothetical protein
MNTVELKERYAALYAAMAVSRDTSKMKLFGTAFTQMFDRVADLKPDIAIATLELLSAIEYNNFVTPVEATEVAEKFINDDSLITGSAEPTRGAHWNMDALKGFLTQRGIALEEKPYYNWPALWLTVNMIYSDYANVVVELVGSKDNERVATACYKMAIKKLKDRDRNHFVREYFDLDD